MNSFNALALLLVVAFCNGNEALRLKSTKKVEIAVYYESMCPYCEILIGKYLYPTYLNLSSIMDIQLVPYGNMHYDNETKEMVCQHGIFECVGNRMHACALKHYEFSQAFDFISCMAEEAATKALDDIRVLPIETAPPCATKTKVKLAPIFKCAISDEGMKLQEEMGIISGKIQPHYRGVPHVTINGEKASVESLYDDGVKYICDTYYSMTGYKPSVCN